MDKVIDLPKFPMTEKFEPWSETFTPRGFVDQSFLFCPGCSHGKLGTIVPPSELYSDGYKTKTGNSVGASHSIKSFFGFIEKHLDLSQFDTVIDIGGNDGSLLNLFHQKKVNVDPNGDGIKCFIEDADLKPFKADRKLILSSHTLEHLENPSVVFEKINETLCYGDACAFQFPSLDSLVRDARIDQIHHQHVNYFSLRSISFLVAKHGFEITHFDFDPMHYGTLQIIFRRGLEELKGSPINRWEIEEADADFMLTMQSFGAAIGRLKGPVGYGASLMLPVLRYYVPNLDMLCAVGEDSADKWGLRWINFNKIIQVHAPLIHQDCVVTAFNTKLAVRKIAAKLTEQGARNVVVPFNTL